MRLLRWQPFGSVWKELQKLHGVLVVHLPKMEALQPRQITGRGA